VRRGLSVETCFCPVGVGMRRLENRRRRQAIATVFTGDGFTVQPATEATGSYAVKPLPGWFGDGAPKAIKQISFFLPAYCPTGGAKNQDGW